MCWIQQESVLASIEKGGLGIGSLKAFSHSLLQKQKWRLVSKRDALWVSLIKAIHGNEAGFNNKCFKTKGAWSKIMGSINHLSFKNIVPISTLCFKVERGEKAMFCIYIWIGLEP